MLERLWSMVISWTLLTHLRQSLTSQTMPLIRSNGLRTLRVTWNWTRIRGINRTDTTYVFVQFGVIIPHNQINRIDPSKPFWGEVWCISKDITIPTNLISSRDTSVNRCSTCQPLRGPKRSIYLAKDMGFHYRRNKHANGGRLDLINPSRIVRPMNVG